MTTEQTDSKALDEMYKLGVAAPPPSFLSRLWTWMKESLFGEPYEPPIGDDKVLRRIRIHEKATSAARKLHKLDPEDAAHILVETAMLLGFPDSRLLAPRRKGDARCR